jgi:hypothetical protein
MADGSLFSVAWADRLVAIWNINPEHHGKLAGAGAVGFRVVDPESPRKVVLYWDGDGFLRRLDTATDKVVPCFSATDSEWRAFISGEYSAVAGVLAGRIEYKGKMSFAFKFGSSFDSVAVTARRL